LSHCFVKIVGLRGLFGEAFAVEGAVLLRGAIDCVLMGNSSGVGEDVALVEPRETIELGHPVAHPHGDTPHGLTLGEHEVLLDQVVERGQFRLIQVVLGDDRVFLARLGPSPVRETHVRLLAIRAGMDDLRSGLAGDRPVHFVLYRLEEAETRFRRRIVIETGRPDPELRRDTGFDPVSDRDDRVEVIEIRRIVLAVRRSRKEILYHCRLGKFLLLKDVLEVLPDVLLSRLKQIGHQLLRQPDRFALETNIKLDRAILSLMDQELGFSGESFH